MSQRAPGGATFTMHDDAQRWRVDVSGAKTRHVRARSSRCFMRASAAHAQRAMRERVMLTRDENRRHARARSLIFHADAMLLFTLPTQILRHYR